MGNRYRYGETSPREIPCALAQDVEAGDLIALDTATLEKASDETWDTDLATTQENFHDKFAGVSAQRSRATLDDADIRHSTKGVHNFACASATFEIGTLVGPAKDSGDALLDGTVVAVATPNLAIGRVAKKYAAATTNVDVEITGVIAHGGPQAMA